MLGWPQPLGCLLEQRPALLAAAGDERDSARDMLRELRAEFQNQIARGCRAGVDQNLHSFTSSKTSGTTNIIHKNAPSVRLLRRINSCRRRIARSNDR